MSLLGGFVGGAISQSLTTDDCKKDGTTYVTPMHSSAVLTIESFKADAALPTDTCVSFDTEYASLGYIYRDMVPFERTFVRTTEDTGSIIPFIDTG